MNKEEILASYHARHACKEFDSTRTLSPEDFDFILETGRLSPSSFGFEPWKFLVVQNRELREKLLPITWGAQKALPTASHFVIILSRTKAELLPESDYISHIMQKVQSLPEEIQERKRTVYGNFLRSDFELLDNDRAVFEWGCRQSYIALGNMMTAAMQIGIDSLPVEGFEKDKVEQLLAAEGLLDPDQFGVSVMVGFGYRIKEPRPKTRRCMDEVVRWVE